MSLRDLLQGLPATATESAAAAPIEAGLKAASAAAILPTGNPEADLANLLAGFEASMGVAPRVNPPEAAKVLATATKAEVSGRPEPEEDKGPAVELPTSKPAEVLAAEQSPKSRRTAAVVQQELDALQTAHNALNLEHQALKNEVAGYAGKVREEFAGETKLLEADKAKAYARAEELMQQLAAAELLNKRAGEAIKALQQRAAAAPAAAPPVLALEDVPVHALGKELTSRGFKVLLEVVT